MHPLLIIILSIITLEFLLDVFLDWINIKHHTHNLPPEVAQVYDPERYKQSIKYQTETTYFGFITSSFTFLLSFAMLYFGGFAKITHYLENFVQNPTVLALIFFGAVFLGSDLLALPFQWYSTFVIEEKYGFNKTTTRTFLLDKLKSYALTILLGGTLLGCLFSLITWLGSGFWWIFWVIISTFMVFLNMFYTSWIVPLFNKLSPLPEGSLRDKIIFYCQSVRFPLANLFVIDGSRRSAKANAYFSGIGKEKKIVLYDTLLGNHTEEEIVSILAHEVGHYKKHHIFFNLLLSVLQTGIMLYILSWFISYTPLSTALGATKYAMHLNLVAFGLLYSPISTILGIGMHYISRKHEFEADNYAKKTYGSLPLIAALKKLTAQNLSNLTPHPVYVFFNYSHPTLLERIRNLQKAPTSS